MYLEEAHLLDHDLNQAIQKFRFKKSKGQNKQPQKNPHTFEYLPTGCMHTSLVTAIHLVACVG